MPGHLDSIAVAGLALLCALTSCASPPEPQAKPVVKLENCPRLAIFEDETELAAGLPVLYRQHLQDLIVIETSVYLNTCSKEHLAGAAEASRVGGAGEASKVAGAAEKSKIGAAGEVSRVADAGEKSRLGDASENSKVALATESARLAAASETSRATGVGMSSRISSAAEMSKIAGMGEASKVGGISESSKVSGTSSSCRCHKGPPGLGYRLVGIPSGRRVRIYDGVDLRRYVDGALGD